MSRDYRTLKSLIVNGQEFLVEELRQDEMVHTVSVDGKRVSVSVLQELGRDPLELLVRVEGRILRIEIEDRDENDTFSLRLNGRPFRARFGSPLGPRPTRSVDQAKGPMVITAPMAGRIVSLKVEAGSAAEKGQSLVVLEAMKMENEIASPRRGIVKEVYVQEGTLVKTGDKLALLE